MHRWNNERILITGASGFVGGHLLAALRETGAHVVGITSGTEGRGLRSCDIRNFHALRNIFTEERISLVYHLAGLSQVETGQTSPHPTFETNITGALHVLENARLHRVSKVIIASTSHVYGDNRVPYRESYVPKPSRPYETSKACIDLLAMSYARTYQLPVYIARFVNIYGPGDLNFTRLVPKTIRSVLSGQPPAMWGGRAVRDYLYIDDAVRAYLKLGETGYSDGQKENIFNFGTSNVLTVKDIVAAIIEKAGVHVDINRIPDLRENEIPAQYVSWAKAKRILGWSPKMEFGDGIEKTVAWYAENGPQWKMRG